VIAELREFLTGVRHEVEIDRVLATILFVDIVGSTARAAALDDTGWRALLDAFYGAARSEIDRFRGRQTKTTGDGLLATFDGPARAIRCADAIRQASRALCLDVRAPANRRLGLGRDATLPALSRVAKLGLRLRVAQRRHDILREGAQHRHVVGRGQRDHEVPDARGRQRSDAALHLLRRPASDLL